MVDYNRERYTTNVTTVSANTLLTLQTLAFALSVTDSTGAPIENARVNLRQSNNRYVRYSRTNVSGIASFEVLPDVQMRLELDYNRGKYTTNVTTVSENTLLNIQTQPLTAHLTSSGVDLINHRVDLLRSNGGYVKNLRTSTDGRATFEVVPGAMHRLRSTYNRVTWRTDPMEGPAEVEHDF